jgi:hypothetical protein
VQGAFGGHPTYPNSCGPHARTKHGLRGLVSDWVVCGSGRFAFRASTTPLVDIAATSWACWKGHFGLVMPGQIGRAKLNEGSVQRAIDSYYLVPGPRSPLWQAENGRLAADGAKSDYGVCDRGATAAEQEALRGGVVGR